VPSAGLDVIIYNDLFLRVVVKGIAGVADFVVTVTVHFLFKPGCFTCIRFTMEPEVSLFACVFWVSEGSSSWACNWPCRSSLSAASTIGKPRLAISVHLAKVLREAIEVCFTGKLLRTLAIFAQVLISSMKVFWTACSLDIGMESLDNGISKFILLAISRKQIEASWICEIQFSVEDDVGVKMRGSVSVLFLLCEASFDSVSWNREELEKFVFFRGASGVGEEAFSCVKSKRTGGFF